MARESTEQRITRHVLEAMQGDELPWRKPWRGESSLSPVNHRTNYQFRGVNVLTCMISQWAQGFETNRWLTLPQANSLNSKIRPGSKSTPGIFYKEMETIDDSGEKVQYYIAKPIAWFNIDQIDGIDYEPQQVAEHEPDDVQDAVDLANALGVPIKSASPHYNHAIDTIGMPDLNQFHTLAGYMGTLAHEVAHATGHKSRLDRPRHTRWGDEAYAFEELVAELSAAFITAKWGMSYQLEHHTSYIQSWLKKLDDDPKAVMQAAAQAQRAVDYIEKELTGYRLDLEHQSSLAQLM